MIGRVLALVAAASWLAAAAAPATAAIYRWIDEEDVVNYTDDFSRFESHRRRARPDDQVARDHDRPRVREVEDSPDALVAPDGSRSARASTNPDAPARSNRAEAVTPAMDAAADEIIRRAGLDAQ